MYVCACVCPSFLCEHLQHACIHHNTTADIAGLLPGCAILTIDGVDIKGLSDPEVRDLTYHFKGKYGYGFCLHSLRMHVTMNLCVAFGCFALSVFMACLRTACIVFLVFLSVVCDYTRLLRETGKERRRQKQRQRARACQRESESER